MTNYFDTHEMIETLRIECPVTEDNPAGFYVINAEDKTDGMTVVGAKSRFDSMTVAELRAVLTEAGMDAPGDAKKADLLALCLSLGE